MQQTETIENIKQQLLETKRTLHKLNNLTKEPQFIPFNSVSFIETQVVQTEEVLICIGADYFIKTPIGKAQEILTRREKNLKEILSNYIEQDQLESMQNELQEIHDKKNKEDQAAPKSILKKPKEKKGEIVEIDGFHEIREEYTEPQEEKKDEAQMIELFKQLQLAFSTGDDEKYFQINQQIQQQSKQKEPPKVVHPQTNNQEEKQIKFKEEPQPKKKLSKFKQERLRQS